MTAIPMLDLKNQYITLQSEINAAIQNVLYSSEFIRGGIVREFEQNLANQLNVKHAIGTANGTDALQIALMALNLQPSDEVIVPDFTFISPAETVALLGLTPVFADVDYDTFNITADSIKKVLTKRTKAIIPVHLFGQCADMESILQIAREHNLFVIEDACQSINADYTFTNKNTIKSGCIGDVGCTSFFPSKNLGAYGDAGAVFTNNDLLAEKIRAIANHGSKIRYQHECIGINSRLDSIQAAILNVKLKYLDKFTAERQNIANIYDSEFADCPEIKIPTRNSQSTHVFHQYTVKIQGNKRDEIRKLMNERGIATAVYYPTALHQQPVFEPFINSQCPISETLSAEVLSLPIFPELTHEQAKYIAHEMKKACRFEEA